MPTNIHLDYASPLTIQIRVHDDRITIWNAVQLPPEWAAGQLVGKRYPKDYPKDYPQNYPQNYPRTNFGLTRGRSQDHSAYACRCLNLMKV